jgi:hypothetical protein
LADDSIFSALGPTALVFDYSLDVQRYPASVSYQFYNADSKSTCPGFYSADTVLRGGLTKGIKWGTPQDNLGVIILQQFESVAEARTAVAGIALSLGPTGKSCSALPTESQTQIDAAKVPASFRVELKTAPLPGLSERIDDYVSAVGANEDPRWVFGAKVAARSGTYVVGVASNTTAAEGQIDPATMANIVNSVVDRLPTE